MSYKAIFAFYAACDHKIELIDIKTAFLYECIDEEIYVKQPTGADNSTKRVCKLKKLSTVWNNCHKFDIICSSLIWKNSALNLLIPI